MRSALCAKRRPSMQTPHGLSSDAACRVAVIIIPCRASKIPHRILKPRIAPPPKHRTDPVTSDGGQDGRGRGYLSDLHVDPVTPKGGQDGRGNLRENREDPAPTVGVDIIASQMPPINAAPAQFCSDVACRVMIKNSSALCRREPHFYQLARLATAILVGAVPSVASARPNSAASRFKTSHPKTPRRALKTPHRHRNPERRPGRAGKSSRKPRRPRPYSRRCRGYHCAPNDAHQCTDPARPL